MKVGVGVEEGEGGMSGGKSLRWGGGLWDERGRICDIGLISIVTRGFRRMG